MKANQLNLRS